MSRSHFSLSSIRHCTTILSAQLDLQVVYLKTFYNVPVFSFVSQESEVCDVTGIWISLVAAQYLSNQWANSIKFDTGIRSSKDPACSRKQAARRDGPRRGPLMMGRQKAIQICALTPVQTPANPTLRSKSVRKQALLAMLPVQSLFLLCSAVYTNASIQSWVI